MRDAAGAAVILPLALAVAPDTLPWTCADCGRLDSAGTAAPGEYLGDLGAYRYEPGPWLCRGCSSTTWAAWLAERRREREDRLALARLARRRPGARMADVERLRARGVVLEEQLVMPWGGR